MSDFATTPTPVGESLPASIPTPTPVAPVAAPAPPAAAPPPARMEDVLRQLAGPPAATQDAAPATAPSAEADDLTVTLPPRREGEEPLAFTAQTREQAEALRRLHNGYTRGEEARAIREEATRILAEQQAFLERVQRDPAGVVLDHLPADARGHLIEALIASHYDDVKPVLERLYENAEELANARAALTDKRTEWGKQAEAARSEAQRKVAVEDAVIALMPPDVDSHAAAKFGDYAARILNAEEFAQPGSVTPERVSELLGDLAARWFPTAPLPAASEGRSTDAPAPAASPAPAPVPASGATVNPQVLAQRAAARAIAPQGAGAAPAGLPTPPKGQTIEQRARWMREQLAMQAGR